MSDKTDVQSIINRAYTLATELNSLFFGTFYGSSGHGEHYFRGYINTDVWVTKVNEVVSGLLISSQTIEDSMT